MRGARLDGDLRGKWAAILIESGLCSDYLSRGSDCLSSASPFRRSVIPLVVSFRDFWGYYWRPLARLIRATRSLCVIRPPAAPAFIKRCWSYRLFILDYAHSLSRHLFPHWTSPLDLSFTSLWYFNIRDERWNPTRLPLISTPSLSWNIHDDFALSTTKKARSWPDNKKKKHSGKV